MERRLTKIAAAGLVAALLACAREEPVPPEIAAISADALRAAAEIKVGGDVESVVRAHPLAPRYASAMAGHFALMRELHEVARRAQLRYPRSAVTVRHDQFCIDDGAAHLAVTAMVRYDMEGIPPNRGTPPYTAGEEQHVFRFERRGGTWMMVGHDEITLAERHSSANRHGPC
jgi:hypothetical protein